MVISNKIIYTVQIGAGFSGICSFFSEFVHFCKSHYVAKQNQPLDLRVNLFVVCADISIAVTCIDN